MSSPDAGFPETQILAIASHVRFVLFRNSHANETLMEITGRLRVSLMPLHCKSQPPLTLNSYVGNTMAVFVMQAMGCEVSAINTVQFSMHAACLPLVHALL